MAEKTTSELERIYTIPLRRAKHGPRSMRANWAVKDVKSFLTRHMKGKQVWLDNEVNQLLWARGLYNIPSRIRVRATRFDDGVVEVTLPESEHAGSVRTEIAERREKAAETPVLAGPAVDEETEGAQAPVTTVPGIGPATAQKLEKAEITTVSDLANASPKAVAEASGRGEDVVQGWIDSAKKVLAEAEKGGQAEAGVEAAAEAEAADETGGTKAAAASGSTKAESPGPAKAEAAGAAKAKGEAKQGGKEGAGKSE